MANSPKLTAQRADYHERIAKRQLAPLWEFFHDWFSASPRVRARPYRWSYAELRSLVLEAASVIDPAEAERRVLVLENPGLAGRRLIAESLYAGLQLIMPGEVAPCHRHSPAALRFVLEGRGAYTAVNGEKLYMEPGDFIVTPSWTWHEHGNDGETPTVWLDVLDVVVIHLFNATFTERYPGQRHPETAPPGQSLHRYGMNMLPADYRRGGGASPVWSYPYARSRDTLERLKSHTEWDACHALKMAFVDPTTGGAAIPTISTFLQLVPAGFPAEPYRTTAATVLAVVEGRGTIRVWPHDGRGAEEVLAYAPKDLLVVPSWHPFAIRALDESVIFGASDEVIQRKLGIDRELRGAQALA